MFVEQGPLFDDDAPSRGAASKMSVVVVGGAARRTLDYLVQRGLHREVAIVADADNADLACDAGAADLVFVIACLGGAGAEAAPAVAELARRNGALVIAVVTMPLPGEGEQRTREARLALREMIARADATLIVDNRLSAMRTDSDDDRVAALDARIESVLRAVSDCILVPSVTSISFEDLSEMFRGPGRIGLVGVGEWEGEDSAASALELALDEAQHGEVGLGDASAMLLHVTGGEGLTIDEFSRMIDSVALEMHDDATWLPGLFSSDREVASFARVLLIPLYQTAAAQTQAA